MWFTGSPGTPSSSPPLAGGALQSPASSVAALHHHHRNNSGNGGHPGGKLPDENSNIQPPRHDSISPASMDSSIQDDERVAKSKFFSYEFLRIRLVRFISFSSLVSRLLLMAKGL